MAFQSFDFECTWWRLFQKRVVRTKFDIYVFITITWSIPLLVDYYLCIITFKMYQVFLMFKWKYVCTVSKLLSNYCGFLTILYFKVLLLNYFAVFMKILRVKYYTVHHMGVVIPLFLHSFSLDSNRIENSNKMAANVNNHYCHHHKMHC